MEFRFWMLSAAERTQEGVSTRALLLYPIRNRCAVIDTLYTAQPPRNWWWRKLRWSDERKALKKYTVPFFYNNLIHFSLLLFYLNFVVLFWIKRFWHFDLIHVCNDSLGINSIDGEFAHISISILPRTHLLKVRTVTFICCSHSCFLPECSLHSFCLG